MPKRKTIEKEASALLEEKKNVGKNTSALSWLTTKRAKLLRQKKNIDYKFHLTVSHVSLEA